VQHELHAAGFVEEALERHHVGGRHYAQAALGFGEIGRDLLSGRRVEPVVLDQ
jgi:hypothetical protein